MKTDRIFVLLLVVLLPMSGCFDDAVGDAEGTDDATDDGSVTEGDGTSTGTATPTQARTWYSSGGVYQTNWDDGQYRGYYLNDTYTGQGYNYTYDNDDNYRSRQISSSSERCLNFGPYYSSSTGEILGERCNEWGYPSLESDWDLTDCTDNGGEIIWNYDDYRYAATCRMAFATINSSVGEALLIYEWSGFSMASTCSGVDVYTGSTALSGKEYVIAPGTALECSHEIYKNIEYSGYESQSETQTIWSIVYAIQDTTVV